MADQIIVFELPDGSVRYATCPASGKNPGELTPEWLLRVFNKMERKDYPGAKRILKAVMPDGKPLVPGPHDHPVEHAFSGAWRHAGGGNIQIDMPAAREIRMEEIRVERNRRLDASDKEWARLMDIGSAQEQATFNTYRQALRDLPATLDLARFTTPEALEPFVPDWPVAG